MAKTNKKIVEVVRVGKNGAGRLLGQSLSAIRDLAGLTQKEMAERLGVGQASISKIEQRQDIQLSSLKKYVETLGADLKIYAAFPADLAQNFNLSGSIDYSFQNDQLILPMFDAKASAPTRDVVLSIHPQYSDKIISGHKTIELRRRFPARPAPLTKVYIYSTSPVMALIGGAEIAGVYKMPIAKIWENYSKHAFISKPDFDAYFSGLEEGFAVRFMNARPFRRELPLTELRERFGFEPPQSFTYAKPELKNALCDEFADIFN